MRKAYLCTKGDCRKPVRLVEAVSEIYPIYVCDSCGSCFGEGFRSPTETTACQVCVSIACPEKQIENQKDEIPVFCSSHMGLKFDRAIQAMRALNQMEAQ